MKIKFTGKPHFSEYHGMVDFVDGETKEVDEATAEYLLSDFGDFFSEVKPTVKVKSIEKPPEDRMVRKNRTKKR